MPGLLSDLMAADDPMAPKSPHFPAKAKRVIFLYMTGGVSQVDSFDPKPQLTLDHGKKVKNRFSLVRTPFNFKHYGQSGTEVSELFPHVGECVDDMCVIRSMKNDDNDHFGATMGIHAGSTNFARPSIGSWVSYGLGTVNQNLPSFMVLAPYLPYAGGQVWSADFLPAAHQGTLILPGGEPIPNMTRRASSAELQKKELGLLAEFDRKHLIGRESDSSLVGRVKSFETAFGMQQEAPRVFDLSKESDATHKLYGLERGSTQGFAWQCLIARRLAERGVRFIELIDSGSDLNKNWDAHFDIQTHVTLARNVDQPIAALLKDLKSRGMLDDTLVVWTTEFGRTPYNENPEKHGREHHNRVFSSWLAGGGVKGGTTYGESDEYGIEVARDMVHFHDFHATILHLLGMDHKRLTYRYSGRDFRLTDVAGEVVKGILA
ncbi:MAG: hypothetical protein QOJ99_5993 [Bryobacterales bacterium]|nr:hypothetical protein [Bryobacterales bacterium]